MKITKILSANYQENGKDISCVLTAEGVNDGKPFVFGIIAGLEDVNSAIVLTAMKKFKVKIGGYVAPPVVTPKSITAAQGMLYLHRNDLLPKVKDWVYDKATDYEVVISFEKEMVWQLDGILITQAKTKFNWTNETTEKMFQEASLI